MLDQIRTVTEIYADNNDVECEGAMEVNQHLRLGWQLIAVHERGWDLTHHLDDASRMTVYILGHKEDNPPRP